MWVTKTNLESQVAEKGRKRCPTYSSRRANRVNSWTSKERSCSDHVWEPFYNFKSWAPVWLLKKWPIHTNYYLKRNHFPFRSYSLYWFYNSTLCLLCTDPASLTCRLTALSLKIAAVLQLSKQNMMSQDKKEKRWWRRLTGKSRYCSPWRALWDSPDQIEIISALLKQRYIVFSVVSTVQWNL